MNYTEALRALDARVPTRMVPDLDRIRALVDLLAHPEASYPAIHITGTNGKTTTARVASRVLHAVGLSTGTYTSPHLETPRERIAVGAVPISQKEFAEVLSYLTPILEQVDARGERVTWFETMTAMAFEYFQEKSVEAAVIEVGMGGEWDATNVIEAPVAVITEVAVDHPELGSTPVDVAREKVGIIKDGAVVLTAERDPAVLALIETSCRERGADLRLAGEAFALERRDLDIGGQLLTIRAGRQVYQDLHVPLFGARLAEDALLGVAASLAFLGDRAIDRELIAAALANVRSPGRIEVVARAPLVVLDGAHNPDAARSLADAMRDSFRWKRLWLVTSILGDKDVAGVLAALVPLADEVVVTRNDSPRAAPVERLSKEVEALGRRAHAEPVVADAVRLAIDRAGEDGCVLVTGSLYTVGQARTLFVPSEE
jgi:dihydrofolate synthase/folylpolyglutamate synthase